MIKFEELVEGLLIENEETSVIQSSDDSVQKTPAIPSSDDSDEAIKASSNDLKGIFNLSSPEHPTKEKLYTFNSIKYNGDFTIIQNVMEELPDYIIEAQVESGSQYETYAASSVNLGGLVAERRDRRCLAFDDLRHGVPSLFQVIAYNIIRASTTAERM